MDDERDRVPSRRSVIQGQQTGTVRFSEPSLLTVESPLAVDTTSGGFSLVVKSTGTNEAPYLETEVTIGAPGFTSASAIIEVPSPAERPF